MAGLNDWFVMASGAPEWRLIEPRNRGMATLCASTSLRMRSRERLIINDGRYDASTCCRFQGEAKDPLEQ